MPLWPLLSDILHLWFSSCTKNILVALYFCHTSRWMRALETIEQISNPAHHIDHSLDCHHLLYCKAHISSVSSCCTCFQIPFTPFLSIPFNWPFKELIYAAVSLSHHCFFFWLIWLTESKMFCYHTYQRWTIKYRMKYNLM